jgi:hypothetical protein
MGRTKVTARRRGADPRCGDRKHQVFRRLDGSTDARISLNKRRRATTKLAAKARITMTSRCIGKQRKGHPEDNVFVNKPFIEEFSDWGDSPEGEQWTEICDAVEDLLKDARIDAKHRQFIWPDAERLDLEQSVQRIHKQYPDFPCDKIEEFLIDWIDMGYAPENYSQAQLDELDRLTERWVAEYMRRSRTAKKGKRTRHS